MTVRRFSPKQKRALLWWTSRSPDRGRDAIICDGAVRSGKTLALCLGFVCWAMATFRGQQFALGGKTILAIRRNMLHDLLPLLGRREAAGLRAMAGMEEGTWSLTEDLPWTVAFHEVVPAAGLAEETKRAEEKPAAQGPVPDEEALAYQYPYASACTAPTKLTATQLKGREKDQEIAENTARPYVRQAFAAPGFLAGRRPMSPEERGTAMHLVMQYLPLDGDVDEVISDLLARKLLTAEQAETVDRRAIRRFLASPLAEELRRAERVEREYRFSLLVPAGEYYPGLGPDEEVLLQGVVDLFAVENDGVTVVDFKTDHVSGNLQEERALAYRSQLQAYSAALERILELPVKRRILYFFHTGEWISL